MAGGNSRGTPGVLESRASRICGELGGGSEDRSSRSRPLDYTWTRQEREGLDRYTG
jgi:hypothetical protein